MERIGVRYISIKKYTLDDLLTGIAMFCVYTYAILENASITFAWFSQFKVPILLTAALCLILMIKAYAGKLMTIKYFPSFFLLAVVCVMLLWGWYVNRNPLIGETPIRATLRLILYLIDVFVLMTVMAEKGQGQKALRFLYRYIMFLVIVNDFVMFTRIVTFFSGRYELYLVGDKFSVSYLHMSFLGLWMVFNRKSIVSYRYSRWKMALLAAFFLIVAIRIDCMTAVVGCAVLVLLLVLLESRQGEKALKLTSTSMLFLLIVGSVVFAFIAEIILSMPIVTTLVTKVLGRDISLTGRTMIYMLYTQTIPDHWLTGYGYGNAYNVTSTLFGFDNVQNAILQWVLQIGVITTAALIAFLLFVFSGITKSDTRNMPSILAIVALIYTFVILGSVETTFNMLFVLCFALIFMLVHERPVRKADKRIAKG